MRPFIYRTFTLSLVLISASARANTENAGTRCHIRMDDGRRFELYLDKKGASVESPLGKISLTDEHYSTLQLDQDIYEVNSTNSHSELTGSVRLKTLGMDESDENMLDDGINKYTQDFDVNIASEMYIRKDQEQGVLTCSVVEHADLAGIPGIQVAKEMPGYYNFGQRSQARIDSFYNNAKLAKASVDTKALVQNRESNFLKLILGDVAKLKLNDETEALDELFVRRLQETNVIDKESNANFDLENISVGSPTIQISSANKNQLEILRRSNGTEYSFIRTQPGSLDEAFQKADLLAPGYSAIERNSLREKKLIIQLSSNGRGKFKATEKSQGLARAIFFSASQYVPANDEFMNSNVFTYPKDSNETTETIKAMGRPMAEVKLASTNIREHGVKVNEQNVFNDLMASTVDFLRKNPPTAAQMEKALADSGLEKSIDSSQAGMTRLLLSESLRLLYGLEANKDSRITKMLEKRINQMIETKAKNKQEKMLAKLIFIDRMKVIGAIERELNINLHISQQDDLQTFQKKAGVALQSLKSVKQQKRVAERLQAWVVRQPVSFNGLCSWTGLDQQTPDNRKKVLELLVSLTVVSKSQNDVKDEALHGINEQIARILISLVNKS